MTESFEIRCPLCKQRWNVSGNIPKWIICDECNVQFIARHNKTGFKAFIKRLFGGIK